MFVREAETNMSQSAVAPPLILTLKIDDTTFTRLDQLRKAHFPSDRNFLAAHITLFHALPGDQMESICATLRKVCAATPSIALALPSVRFLGRGVAITVECPPLLDLRRQLADRWQGWLTPQDRQRYQPHVTIQNKVDPAVARNLYEQLTATWQPLAGLGEGLLLWRYLGGPWAAVAMLSFGGSEAA